MTDATPAVTSRVEGESRDHPLDVEARLFEWLLNQPDPRSALAQLEAARRRVRRDDMASRSA